MNNESEPEKPSITLPGTVEKIIAAVPSIAQPEKAQISIEGADHLYREIRVENALEDEKGETVQLRQGAKVDVTIEADPNDTKHSTQENPTKHRAGIG